MRYLGLGAEIMVTLAGPIALGVLVDRYFDTAPVGTLSGVVLGLVLFFMMMFRLVDSFTNDGDKR